jgi:endoglucanase
MILLCVTVCYAHAQDPVKKWGQLQVKGSQLCDQHGQPVILRGVSFGWHNLWPRFYNKKAVQTLKQDWHASVVRAAMGIMIEDNYLENPSFAMQCMTPVIEAAIKQNVYVIID